MPTVCIVSASGQNVFFEELLAAFESALRRTTNLRIKRAVDHFPRLRDDLAYLFVPHEYMPLTQYGSHPTPGQLRRSVALCTEQPGTTWFDQALPVAKQAGRAIDINEEGTRELRRKGVPAETLQLGYVPEWDHWGGDDGRERPFDLTFMGGYTSRRAKALASCGRVLLDRTAAIHLFDTRLPHTAASDSFFSGTRKWEHLASSKVILNVHRSPLAYLEWQRVLGAMANGCVVLTERSLGSHPLVAGDHFVSTTAENIPAVLRGLLDDEELLATIRGQAYETLRKELPLDRSISLLADALDDVSRANVEGLPLGRLQPRPQPLPPTPPLPEYQRLVEQRTDTDVMRMALKHLILGQADIARSLRPPAVVSEPDRVETYGQRRDRPPQVSVVLTVYNYATVVGEAIASVAGSDHDDYELVVVEDASTDQSLDAIRAALRAHPWIRATLIARGSNQGLAAARNLGVACASADSVFILDADNAIYPHCLSRLDTALAGDPDVSFVYGLLEVFDSGGARDLMSWREWDPYQLRFGNYVDAMALIRKSAIQNAGGYTLDRRLYGWEDFALWCALADLGARGVRIPEILGRYRASGASMISITDVDASAAWGVLAQRYSVLSVDPSAGSPAPIAT